MGVIDEPRYLALESGVSGMSNEVGSGVEKKKNRVRVSGKRKRNWERSVDSEKLTLGTIEEEADSCSQEFEKVSYTTEGVICTGNENCVISIFNIS